METRNEKRRLLNQQQQQQQQQEVLHAQHSMQLQEEQQEMDQQHSHHQGVTYVEHKDDEVMEDPEDIVEVEDEGVSPKDIGRYIREHNFQTNIDILECTGSLTDGIPCLDVMDVISPETKMTDDVRNCIAGLCVMVNRLMTENQYIMRELQALKTNYSAEGINRFDHLVFRKLNIVNPYQYPGEAGIPPSNLNKISQHFDLNAIRRNEGAINTLRRFVKFLLDHVIPEKLHSKFTVRERRSGVVHLEELPPILMGMIRDICLESVNLLDVHTIEDKSRREDMTDYLTKFIKYALQEIRRVPRKTKKESREAAEERHQTQQKQGGSSK